MINGLILMLEQTFMVYTVTKRDVFFCPPPVYLLVSYGCTFTRVSIYLIILYIPVVRSIQCRSGKHDN